MIPRYFSGKLGRSGPYFDKKSYYLLVSVLCIFQFIPQIYIPFVAHSTIIMVGCTYSGHVLYIVLKSLFDKNGFLFGPYQGSFYVELPALKGVDVDFTFRKSELGSSPQKIIL